MTSKDFQPIKSLLSGLRDLLGSAASGPQHLTKPVLSRLESYEQALKSQQELIERAELSIDAEDSDLLRVLELVDASAAMLLEDAEELIREIASLKSDNEPTSYWC